MRKGLIGISILLAIAMTLVFSLGFLGQANAFSSQRKIVVFQEGISDTVKEEIVLKHNCTFIKNLHLVNAAVCILPEQAEKARTALLAEENVVRVDDDLVIKAIARPDKPGGGKEPEPQPEEVLPWGVDRIDADLAWESYYTGFGVNVAILDTGIDIDHPDLYVAGGVNIINPRKSHDDDNGHGTHCAGIVAALDNEIGVIGVAPDASLYAVKVLDRRGSGWLSDVIAGLEWCIDNGIQVINESFGSSSDNDTFYEAIKKVYEAGITQVAAAGNDYGSSVVYPAAYSETIAVTASDKDDGSADFNSIGPEVDLIAPGVDIYSTYKGGDYKTLSGTSMAAPHVVGTVALVLDAEGTLSPEEVKERLQATAEWLEGLSSLEQGSGLVDAGAATGL